MEGNAEGKTSTKQYHDLQSCTYLLRQIMSAGVGGCEPLESFALTLDFATELGVVDSFEESSSNPLTAEAFDRASISGFLEHFLLLVVIIIREESPLTGEKARHSRQAVRSTA